MTVPNPESYPPLTDRVAAWVRRIILANLVPIENPGAFWRWAFRQPVHAYELGLGWIFGDTILVLTTIGRTTGKMHKTPLEYAYDPKTDSYLITAGWGGRTDWYRNVCANPHVHVQLGRREFDACAERASDEEVARRIMEVARVDPSQLSIFQRWCDRPIQLDSPESLVYAARFFPSFKLTPHKAA